MDLYAPFSADIQAELYKAEAEMLRFVERARRLPYFEYISETLMAIDAVFAIRMSCDVKVPPAALVCAYDVAIWKYGGDARRCLNASSVLFQLPDECCEATIEAMNYMMALEWVSKISQPGYSITTESLLHLHSILLNGGSHDVCDVGFRKGYLPYKKGISPAEIPHNMDKLCEFANRDYFSPLGQASVIHRTFERIVPFESMIDRTGLVFSLFPLFRRELYSNGCIVPICWGNVLERDFRKKLKDASRNDSNQEGHRAYRDEWAASYARNTYLAVNIANRFLIKVEDLRNSWRRKLNPPANSALEGLLDLFLAIPQLAIRHASCCIGKSYGATNEAMHQLVKAGIVEEIPLDNRERVFVCAQSADIVVGFVTALEKTAVLASEAGQATP